MKPEMYGRIWTEASVPLLRYNSHLRFETKELYLMFVVGKIQGGRCGRVKVAFISRADAGFFLPVDAHIKGIVDDGFVGIMGW